MWGNTLGWFISLLLVIATACGVIYLSRLDRMTPPTELTTNAGNLASLNLPLEASPAGILPELTGPADPSALFRQAIDAYLADPNAYDRAVRGDVPPNFDSLPAIAPLLDAALAPSDSAVLAPMMDDVITLTAPPRPLEAIATLGEACVRAGLVNEKHDPALAIAYYNVALALGEKLYHERLVYGELVAGMTMMSEASIRLSKLTKDPQRATALEQFETGRRSFVIGHVLPIYNVLGAVDPGIVGRHAGDVFKLARDSKERLWRVEAMYALARYQFTAPKPRDRAAARQALIDYASNDPDPIVRRAAIVGRDLKVEEWRTLK